MDDRDPAEEKRRQEEIDDVIREEVPRRRPIDTDAIRKRQRLRTDAIRMMRKADEATLRELLVSEYGLTPGSPEFVNALRAWRAMQR